jgi:hypothetical protein
MTDGLGYGKADAQVSLTGVRTLPVTAAGMHKTDLICWCQHTAVRGRSMNFSHQIY